MGNRSLRDWRCFGRCNVRTCPTHHRRTGSITSSNYSGTWTPAHLSDSLCPCCTSHFCILVHSFNRPRQPTTTTATATECSSQRHQPIVPHRFQSSPCFSKSWVQRDGHPAWVLQRWTHEPERRKTDGSSQRSGSREKGASDATSLSPWRSNFGFFHRRRRDADRQSTTTISVPRTGS